MNNKKLTLDFGKQGIYNLGIQVFLASNIKSGQLFVIIADVNPASCCYLKNVTPGDILQSINGIVIDTSDTFNKIFQGISQKTIVINQILVIKNGILDDSDLIKRCICSPCSEFCKTWNTNAVKISKKIDNVDKAIFANISTAYKLKCAKVIKDNEPTNKIAYSSQTSEVSVKSMKPNIPKITFHQRVQRAPENKKSPMANQTSTININYKANKSGAREMLTQRQPIIIRRLNANFYGDRPSDGSFLKQAKSLNNLTELSDTEKLSANNLSSSSSSGSLSSTNSQLGVIRPTPNITIQQLRSVNRRSIELEDVMTMKGDSEMAVVKIGNKLMYSGNFMDNLNKQLKKVRQKEYSGAQFYHPKSLSSENLNS